PGKINQCVRAGEGFELTLCRLSDADVEGMLGATLGITPPRDRLASIQRLAEGNPYFVEELLKALAVGGELRSGELGWQWQPPVEGGAHLPPGVQQAVAQHVSSLSANARSLVLLAAVVGRRFDLRLLHALSDMDEPALLAAIKELIGAQLVLEATHDVFTFR